MQINPYLNFDGNAEEAFQFYQPVFGGDLFVQRMSEVPEMDDLLEKENKLCYAYISSIAQWAAIDDVRYIALCGTCTSDGNNTYIPISLSLRIVGRRRKDYLEGFRREVR